MQGTLPHVEHRLPLDMPGCHFLRHSEKERHANTSAIIVATSVENGVELSGNVGAGKRADDYVGSGRTVPSKVVSPPHSMLASPKGRMADGKKTHHSTGFNA